MKALPAADMPFTKEANSLIIGNFGSYAPVVVEWAFGDVDSTLNIPRRESSFAASIEFLPIRGAPQQACAKAPNQKKCNLLTAD